VREQLYKVRLSQHWRAKPARFAIALYNKIYGLSLKVQADGYGGPVL